MSRIGVVTFGDASLSVWEEGKPQCEVWSRQFKRDVFARIVQTLNRIGWTVGVHEDNQSLYGKRFALNFRSCVKGSLRGELQLSGRMIKFEMWQGVHTPTRPDHGGRYESDKEAVMPYLLSLEMERTRRRIRTYLRNVFPGYSFEDRRWRMEMVGPALERIERSYKQSWHFKGDASNYTISDCNRRTRDGSRLEHGQRVWFFDRKGRCRTGTAYYNINNMWWVACGKFELRNLACFELLSAAPSAPRAKQNTKLAIEVLSRLVDACVKRADFERAALLRDVLAREHGHDLRAAAVAVREAA